VVLPSLSNLPFTHQRLVGRNHALRSPRIRRGGPQLHRKCGRHFWTCRRQNRSANFPEEVYKVQGAMHGRHRAAWRLHATKLFLPPAGIEGETGCKNERRQQRSPTSLVPSMPQGLPLRPSSEGCPDCKFAIVPPRTWTNKPGRNTIHDGAKAASPERGQLLCQLQGKHHRSELQPQQ